MTKDKRTEQIAAARQMLDWLEANPDVPLTPWGSDLSVSHPILAATDEDGMAQIQAIAVHIGEDVTTYALDYPAATKSFGAVEYRAYYVPRDEMDEHHALTSYRGSVKPEAVAS